MRYGKILVIMTCICMLYILFFSLKTSQQNCHRSSIVILNGPSASGKSTVAKEFTKLFTKPYLKIGIDNFFVGVLPEQFVMGPVPKPETPDDVVMQGISSQDKNGNPLFTLYVGPAGQKVISGMHHAIAAYASQGNNVIVDYIAYEPAWVQELVNVLQDCDVYFIGIDIPLAVLEEREKSRATSPRGHARSHYDTVHADYEYDLRLDTSLLTGAQAAAALKEYIQTHAPKAFKHMKK